MKYSSINPRPLAPGMGEAVARRSVLRKFNKEGELYNETDEKANLPFVWETWGQVASRVAQGNAAIEDNTTIEEQDRLQDHLANASILLSGRSLQHGDAKQPTRNKEVFTNCSTAATSFLKYYLLLNGSGVGRCYDDDLMIVDWSKIPYIHCVLDETHPDYDYRSMESLAQAYHKFGRSNVTTYTVQDSREGWAHLLEYIERLAYEGTHSEMILVADFSPVREKDRMIKGMQNRKTSGPVPLMNAIHKVASLKGSTVPVWKQTMYVDHYMAESVLVGGARRSARICVKYWRDPGIIEYINLKNARINGSPPLWSANDSVGVDDEFWKEVHIKGSWAKQVFDAVCEANYTHQTGEPGFLNLHRIKTNNANLHKTVQKDNYSGSKQFPIVNGHNLLKKISQIVRTKKFYMIVNPCGEIVLNILGGYCLVGDVVPYHCQNMIEAEEAVRLTTRALIRLNLLDCVYKAESDRTNRIGVSLTGVHEWAWSMFGLGFRDLIDERKSMNFWEAVEQLSFAVKDEAHKYSAELGVVTPHTDTTIKPSGSVSKLFGLTEGLHLASMREYLRWVQFKAGESLVLKYKDLGYKVRDLKSYQGTSIVAFPTQPEICKLNMGDKLITASEATIEEQFKWVKLFEKYWLKGQNSFEDTGNQISYTIKYKPSEVTQEQFRKMILDNMPGIKCVSIMPQEDASSYEYQPEQSVNLNDYTEYIKSIKQEVEEDIDRVHLECAGGICPVDINKEEANQELSK